MILNRQIALKLDALAHPDVEQAILLLLDTVLEQEQQILDDLDASEARIRAFQGKNQLIKQLKTYKQRILDALR